MDARVSTSLVHYHFESREALLAEALEHSFELAGDVRIGAGEGEARSHTERLRGDGRPVPPLPRKPGARLAAVGGAVAPCTRRPELRKTAARLYERMHEWFAGAIAAGVADGEFAECDVDALTDRVLAMLDGFGIRTLVRDPAVSLEWAREEVWRALARGGPRPEAAAAITFP